MRAFYKKKRLVSNPSPTESLSDRQFCGKEYELITNSPGPPWLTSPWARQKLGTVCKWPGVLTVHPRPPGNWVSGRGSYFWRIHLILFPRKFRGLAYWELSSSADLRVHVRCAVMLDHFGTTDPISARSESQPFELLGYAWALCVVLPFSSLFLLWCLL